MRRSTILGVVVAALIAGSPARSAETRDLLLITIDTIRADYLGCNGSQKVRTPHLDRLAREGVNFRRARSPVPLTLPAHASILTGNYPPTHTVRSNGEYRLPDQQLSLAELLQSQGYRTAAFLGSFVLDRRFGLAQGFAHYDDRVWSEIEELEQLEAERTGDEVLAAFLDWLAQDDGSVPVFAWIHLYDPHAPYEPPEPFRSQYLEDPYGGEVAYVDSIVGRILSELESRQRLSRTLVAVVGDHGEGLGDHGELTHSLLIYNSTLHVPMMLWAPGTVAAGRSIDQLVRVIDLAPTLLDYLGFASEFGEGISLRRRIEAGPEASAQPGDDLMAYSESLYPELVLRWSALWGLETADYRLILAPESELFHVGKDPAEIHDTIDSEPAVYQRLKRQLAESIRAFESRAGPAEETTPDSESRDKLQSLGYLSTSGKTSGRRGPLPDPKNNIDLWNRIQRGIAQLAQARYEQAISTFEAVLADDPDIPLVYEYLGTCWRKLAEDAEAEKVYKAAVERGLVSSRIHHELGTILLQRGKAGSAARELQAALALDPRSVVILYDLGNLSRHRGEYARAIEHYLAAVEINPSHVWSWNGLGMSFAARGEANQALEAFERVVDIDPQGAAGYFNLAVQLERSGLGPRAIEAYQSFLELSEGGDFESQRRQAENAIVRLSG